MWRVLALVSVLVACKAADDGDDYPVVPGGPGPGGNGQNIDAPPPVDAADPDAVMTIAGRVCLVGDLRGLACAATGASGLTVTLGTKETTTADSGAFAIEKPAGTNLVWRVSGGAIVPSVMPFGTSTTIPAIDEQDYADLQNANSVLLVAGEGSILARVVRANTAQASAAVGIAPVARFPTKYDSTTPLAWTELATGAAGMAWIPGASLGTNVVTATPATGTAATENVVVEDQAITYVTIELP